MNSAIPAGPSVIIVFIEADYMAVVMQVPLPHLTASSVLIA